MSSEWQPIETAPKDRTRVLVAGDVVPTLSLLDPSPAVGTFYSVAGSDEAPIHWYRVEGQGMAAVIRWMPLPPPPEST